jgi:branched-chain amino acid transport system ATP-binding protein
LLRVRNITSCYGKIRALQNVSLHVWKGEIVSIIGANGAGKTTLINTISGIVSPLTGGIMLDGKDITKKSPEDIVGMGLTQVPEGRQIFNPLTVLDNLKLGAYLRYRRGQKKKIQQDIEEVFSMFPILGQRRRQRAGTLSGGEQQMLAIARGLMARPSLLMLDEPSLGLAPKIAAEIMDVIVGLKEKGLTILLIEQNARAALAASDRSYVIETGNVIVEGEGRALLHDGDVKRAYLGRDYGEFWE